MQEPGVPPGRDVSVHKPVCTELSVEMDFGTNDQDGHFEQAESNKK